MGEADYILYIRGPTAQRKQNTSGRSGAPWHGGSKIHLVTFCVKLTKSITEVGQLMFGWQYLAFLYFFWPFLAISGHFWYFSVTSNILVFSQTLIYNIYGAILIFQ